LNELYFSNVDYTELYFSKFICAINDLIKERPQSSANLSAPSLRLWRIVRKNDTFINKYQRHLR
jgi:hypothetical protein